VVSDGKANGYHHLDSQQHLILKERPESAMVTDPEIQVIDFGQQQSQWLGPFIGVKDMEESKPKHQFGRQQNPQQYAKEGHSFVGTSKDGRPSTLLGR